MKKLLFLILVGTTLGFLSGCSLDDDDYSLDNAWVGFGLVQKSASGDSFTIKMDDGEVLYPVTYAGYWHEVTNNERILTNFTILGNRDNVEHNEEYYVRINSLRKILFKDILDITPAIEDSIGKDAIKVKDVWIKNNLLNFELQYRGGNKVHYINLVKQPGVVSNGTDPIILELRHNANDDADQFALTAIVTFDLSSLKVEGKTNIPVKVTAKSFTGDDFEFTGSYKY